MNGTLPVGRADDVPAIAGGRPVRDRSRRLIFGAPVISESDVEAVADCLRSGWIGLGPRVTRLEQEFAAYKRAPFAAAVSSGTAALHLAMAALDIGPGDEVIAPTMTFCATAHAIIHAGATPVFADCDPATHNIDAASVEQAVTPRTRAIIVVHMSGRPCDMDAIMAVAARHGLRVIEDCAHAVETEYHGRPAGLIGDAGCFSFYPTKAMTTGDGGMVLTRDARLHERVKLMSLHGMTSDAWTRAARGGVGYDVVSLGFKYNMTDMEAALGLSQLREVDARHLHRQSIWNFFNEHLEGLPLVLPLAPEPDTRHAYHLYTPLLVTERLRATRAEILAALGAENIGTGIHYEPVHLQSYYRERFGFVPGSFPNAETVGSRTFSLPMTAGMSEADAADVCRAVIRVLRYFETPAAVVSGFHSSTTDVAAGQVLPRTARRARTTLIER